MSEEHIKISLCTTCHNRTYQFVEVFAKNIEILNLHPDVEWIVVNYNSHDNLDYFIRGMLPNTTDRFVYVIDNIPKIWHAGIANNISHRCATNSSIVVMNLDADNFIGDSIDLIKNKMINGTVDLLHTWSGNYDDGTYGRIAIKKNKFYEICGYDESFYPMGYQDTDFINRARLMGSNYLRVPCGENFAILNTKDDWVKYCSVPGMTWREFNLENKRKSNFNIKNGKLVANNNMFSELNIIKIRGNGKLPFG